MDAILYRWPSAYPPACPPSDAEPASKRVLRIVATIPPTQADFVPKAHFQLESEEEKCKAAGLSVYLLLKDAKRTRKRTGAMREYHIAAVELSPPNGVLKHTVRTGIKSSHHTWWVPDGFDICSLQFSDAEA
jgi:hypothetical protein